MAADGWRTVRLKNLISGSIKNGYSPLAAECETGYWVMGLGALGDNGLLKAEIKPVEPTEKVKSALLKKDDFLVSRSNTPDKVGRSIRYRGEIPNCSYPDLMMRFRVNDKVADPAFIEHKLKSAPLRQHFKKNAAGSSRSMVKINKATLEATPIDLPALPEQQEIGKILSTWDRAIATTEQLLANSERQKKALMQSLLTGKKRLAEFEGKWQELKLGDLCLINPSRPPKPSDGWVSFVSMDSVSENAKLTRTEVREYSTLAKGFTPFVDNDVLVAKITPCFENGKGALVCGLTNGRGFGSTEFHVLRAKGKVSPHFIYYLTITPNFRAKGEASMQGSVGQKRVTTNYLRTLKVRIPPAEEQIKIASVLDSAEQEVESLRTQLSCLKGEKKSLMQQLLTGKRRVKLTEEPDNA